MTVRPIDAAHVLNDINWHHKPTPVSEFESGFNQGLNQAMWIITHAPTLTPPNEPLTWEELKQMAGEPVYIVEPKKSFSSAYWVLIDEVDEKSMWCVVGIGSACLNFYKTYGKTWIAYRRPPEGEEDTK